jgi:hypothetical protein
MEKDYLVSLTGEKNRNQLEMQDWIWNNADLRVGYAHGGRNTTYYCAYKNHGFIMDKGEITVFLPGEWEIASRLATSGGGQMIIRR